MIKITIFIAIIILSLNVLKADDVRKFETILNPNCTNDDCNNDNLTILYVKATGHSDILHILYSTISTFTMALFKTDLNVTININWTAIMNEANSTIKMDSIEFSGPIRQSCAYLIPTIYEFNDNNGYADMTRISKNLTYWNVRHTNKLNWTFILNNNSDSTYLGTFRANDAHNMSSGSFLFNLKYFGKEKRDSDLPHYFISSESSSIEFVIDSINSTFKDSKFGLTFLFVAQLDGVRLVESKTLDDEYTPGTFNTMSVENYDPLNTDIKPIYSFLQWKPIFYTDKTKTLENSAQLRNYELIANNRKIPNSIALAFYDSVEQHASALNISFGLEGDEKDGYFYSQTSYSSWSFVVGLSTPAKEKMSAVVSVVIFIGFGLPALVIVIGIAVLIWKKIKNRSKSNYQQL